jgi:hypothetical protein
MSPDRAEALMLALCKPPQKFEFYLARDLPSPLQEVDPFDEDDYRSARSRRWTAGPPEVSHATFAEIRELGKAKVVATPSSIVNASAVLLAQTIFRCGLPGDRLKIQQTGGPSRLAAATPKPMMRRTNTSITTMTYKFLSRIDSQQNRSWNSDNVKLRSSNLLKSVSLR